MSDMQYVIVDSTQKLDLLTKELEFLKSEKEYLEDKLALKD